MPMEFQIPSLRIQVRERLSEKELEKIRLETLCELEEHQIASLLQLELEQRRRKAFVDRRRRNNENEFDIRRPVLVFQTRMHKATCRESCVSGGLNPSGLQGNLTGHTNLAH